LLPRNGEDAPEPVPLVGGALTRGVDEHERALALPDIAEDLLRTEGPSAQDPAAKHVNAELELKLA
jgi:hypothetical protein